MLKILMYMLGIVSVTVAIAFMVFLKVGYQPEAVQQPMPTDTTIRVPQPKIPIPPAASEKINANSSHEFTPDDAYDEGYECGYKQGFKDGQVGNNHSFSYDDSSDYSGKFEEKYSYGYFIGYDDGYYRGYAEFEQTL